MYDIVIIGAGPAGLTAAIYARRAGKTVLVLEKETFGGQMTFSPKLENYPGFETVSGNDLAQRMLEQAMALGADVDMDTVTGIENSEVKTVIGENGTYEARAVIVAAGARHRRLGLPREEDFIGNGLSFCAVCDGAFYQGGHVAVIGGGNTALQEIVLLSETCAKVTVVQNLVEGPVADRAEGQTVADEVLLPGQIQPAVPGSGGDDDGPCFIGPVLADHGLDRAVFHAGHEVHIHVGPQGHGLLQHPLGQVVAGDGLKAGIVL